jgi:hypothetical protein
MQGTFEYYLNERCTMQGTFKKKGNDFLNINNNNLIT